MLEDAIDDLKRASFEAGRKFGLEQGRAEFEARLRELDAEIQRRWAAIEESRRQTRELAAEVERLRNASPPPD